MRPICQFCKLPNLLYLCKLPATHFGPQRGKLQPGQRKSGPLSIIFLSDEDDEDALIFDDDNEDHIVTVMRNK